MSLIINPYRFGGGAPPTPGLPPTSLTGLTFWYDGDNSPHYAGNTSTSGLVTTNNTTFQRVDSAASLPLVFVPTAGTFNRKVPASTTNNGAQSVNTAVLGGSVQPAPGAAPSSNATLASFVTNTSAVVIAAFKVDACTYTTVGSPFNGPAIFADTLGGYFGLCYRKSGSNVVVDGYNYDGSTDIASVTATALSTWIVATVRHSGGNLQTRVNGGAWTTVASGNTGSMTGRATLMQGAAGTDHTIAQVAVCNANNSDAAILEVEKYVGSFVGLTI